MKMQFTLSLCAIVLAAPALAQSTRMQPPPQVDQWHLQHYPFDNPDLPAEQRIDNLLSLMTVDEKIDCLGTNTAVPRLGVPNIGSSEGIHGVVQRRSAAAASHHHHAVPAAARHRRNLGPRARAQAAGVEGYEARYITQTAQYNRQILMLWGPQADLARDPRWGRSEEVYGEDPFFNGTMVTAFVHGLQGDDPKYWQSASLLKHFLANYNEDHRNSSSSDFDERLFWEYYSVPFRMGFLDGGAAASWPPTTRGTARPWPSIPSSHSSSSTSGASTSSPATAAPSALVNPRHAFPDQKAAVVACLKAGINQFLDSYKDEVNAASKKAPSPKPSSTALSAANSAFTLKLGLLDPPEMVPYTAIKDSPEPWDTDRDHAVSREDRARVRRAAQERQQHASPRQEQTQIHRRHRPARRLRPLGLVRRHASLRRHAARTAFRTAGRPRRQGQLRRL